MAFIRTLGTSLVLLVAMGTAEAQAPAPTSAAGQAAHEEATRARAKQLFETAVADFDAGRYEAALAGFQEAFRIRPHPLVRVNMANCYDKLGKPLQAIFHFEQFLSADVGTTEQREQVTSAVARLKKQIGQVLVRVAPDGAKVIIDGGEQRVSPIVDAVQLQIGRHTIEVRLEGYKSVHRSFTVEGGTTFEMNVALEPGSDIGAPPVSGLAPALSPRQAAATPPGQSELEEPIATTPSKPPIEKPRPMAVEKPAAKSQPDNTHRGLPASVWVVGGATVAAAVAGTVTGILALGDQSDFVKQRDIYRAELKPDSLVSPLQRQAAYDNAVRLSNHAHTLALTTDLLFGAALVGAIVTTVLIVTHSKHPSSTSAVASVNPSQPGLSLGTSF